MSPYLPIADFTGNSGGKRLLLSINVFMSSLDIIVLFVLVFAVFVGALGLICFVLINLLLGLCGLSFGFEIVLILRFLVEENIGVKVTCTLCTFVMLGCIIKVDK